MQMGAYQIRGGMSRRKEDLKGGMLNEQGWGGKQASFSGGHETLFEQAARSGDSSGR